MWEQPHYYFEYEVLSQEKDEEWEHDVGGCPPSWAFSPSLEVLQNDWATSSSSFPLLISFWPKGHVSSQLHKQLVMELFQVSVKELLLVNVVSSCFVFFLFYVTYPWLPLVSILWMTCMTSSFFYSFASPLCLTAFLPPSNRPRRSP